MRAIIFDIDGTLLQSMAVDTEHFERSIIEVLGSVQFREDYYRYEHVTDRGVVEELMADNGFQPDATSVSSIRETFVRALSDHIEASGPFKEVPGAAKFLKRLSIDADTRVAIATGGWQKSALLKLKSSGVNVTGIPLATCDDAVARTDIMQIALERLGASFDSVTYFGDAQWDVDACEKLGWDFVAVGPDVGGIDSYEDFLF
jgi:phosphoglycolate phosphatase-like HAD superfamily hydrolase